MPKNGELIINKFPRSSYKTPVNPEPFYFSAYVIDRLSINSFNLFFDPIKIKVVNIFIN